MCFAMFCMKRIAHELDELTSSCGQGFIVMTFKSGPTFLHPSLQSSSRNPHNLANDLYEVPTYSIPIHPNWIYLHRTRSFTHTYVCLPWFSDPKKVTKYYGKIRKKPPIFFHASSHRPAPGKHRPQDVFAKYAETFEKIGVNANNGLGEAAQIWWLSGKHTRLGVIPIKYMVLFTTWKSNKQQPNSWIVT